MSSKLARKLSSPLRSKFFSANVTLGVPTLIRLAAGVAKSKTAALLLGPAGVGIVGVGSQIQSLGVTCASLGASPSFVRQLSACIAQKDHVNKRDLLGTSFTLQVLSNLPLLVLGLFLIHPLARWVFGSSENFRYLLPILVAIPIQCVMTAHLWGVFYAHGALKLLARASVFSSVVEVIAYISLVRLFGITGAFWGFTIGMIAWFSYLVMLASRLEPLRDIFHFRLRKDYLRQLVGNGLLLTLSGATTYLVNALIRIKIIHSLGEASAGIYQVVMALTAYYIPYFTNGVWGRLFPKISAHGLDAEGKYEWSEALILTAFLASAVQITLMAVAGPLVALFYSHDFGGAAPLAPLQFTGDLFYLISIPCLGVMMGLNRMRLYGMVWISYYAILYGLTYLGMAKGGLSGAVLAYLASNMGLSIFCLGFYLRQTRGSFHSFRALISILASASAVSVQAYLCLHYAEWMIRGVMPVLWGSVAASVLLSPHIKRLLLINGYAPPKGTGSLSLDHA